LAIGALLPAAPTRIGIVGTGPVGLAHARFLRRSFPYAEIVAFSPSQQGEIKTRAAAFAASGVEIASRLEVVNSDVITLCTSSLSPVLLDSEFLNAQLVTSVGTNEEAACEVSHFALDRVDIFCDSTRSCPLVAGDLRKAIEESVISPLEVRGDLGSLLSGVRPTFSGKTVYYRATGLAVEDIAAAAAFLKIHGESYHG